MVVPLVVKLKTLAVLGTAQGLVLPLFERPKTQLWRSAGLDAHALQVVLSNERCFQQTFDEEWFALDVPVALVGGQDARYGEQVALLDRTQVVLQTNCLQSAE